MIYFPHHRLTDAIAHAAAGGLAVWEWTCPSNPRRRVVKLIGQDHTRLILTAGELGVHPNRINIQRDGRPEQHIVLPADAAERAKQRCDGHDRAVPQIAGGNSEKT